MVFGKGRNAAEKAMLASLNEKQRAYVDLRLKDRVVYR